MSQARLWPAPILAGIAAALMTVGFFLPWFEGAADFAARDFSGFDLARLLRNLDLVEQSSGESGRLRASAIALYMVPALGINGALFTVIPATRPFSVPALVVASVYGCALLLSLLVLSMAQWTDLERVLGSTLPGYWIAFLGSLLAGAAAKRQLLGQRPP